MKNIYSDNKKYPQDANFLNKTNYIRRAGIIPFIKHEKTYILLGLSKDDNPLWSDLGGRSEKDETVLETAVREYGEESRYVLPINLNNIENILITGKNNKPEQVLLTIQVDLKNLNINDYFQKTIPKTKYEDEMSELKWFIYEDFLLMDNLSGTMKNIQKLLQKNYINNILI